MLWLGEWNLFHLDNYSSETGDVLMPTLLTVFGLLGLFAASSYVSSSWIVTDFQEGKPPIRTSTLLLQVHACIGMLSYITYISGIWVILDIYGFESTLLRNFLYAIAGCLMCFCTGSLASNFMMELELHGNGKQILVYAHMHARMPAGDMLAEQLLPVHHAEKDETSYVDNDSASNSSSLGPDWYRVAESAA